MEGMNVKSMEERSEGDVASPSSTGTQARRNSFKLTTFNQCRCSMNNDKCIKSVL